MTPRTPLISAAIRLSDVLQGHTSGVSVASLKTTTFWFWSATLDGPEEPVPSRKGGGERFNMQCMLRTKKRELIIRQDGKGPWVLLATEWAFTDDP